MERNAVYKRSLTGLKMPPDVRALSDAELDAMIDDLRRREVAEKKKLCDRCIDRRCRRFLRCAAGGGRCICPDVPGVGKRDLKRRGIYQSRRRLRI
jgi:hypothetical protein